MDQDSQEGLIKRGEKKATPSLWASVPEQSSPSVPMHYCHRLGNRCDRVSVFGSKSCVFLAICLWTDLAKKIRDL